MEGQKCPLCPVSCPPCDLSYVNEGVFIIDIRDMNPQKIKVFDHKTLKQKACLKAQLSLSLSGGLACLYAGTTKALAMFPHTAYE